MRGCYNEPGHWGSVALPIPYRVHVINVHYLGYSNYRDLYVYVSIPYRVHVMLYWQTYDQLEAGIWENRFNSL